ncbi:SDR family oxidoreductase [Rhizorhabdus dicambivorans]|uniref:3-oxoacyl-ACP reductase n=1 Tax=Rhizorhabdus dicambivorans TaxID=1850238 RepID=A0A2A4FRB2_9SPHN|nr:SDR family oxidoreductase [Rhizorhabdus dicambivorans]ATE67258.1 3-oxoacyl-ACP reductase [Rhizorhabdus dicambivorans]PCE39988.1 3-oxoacyl-ACP reductase [Rhizorhabdus dicambivorans]
MVDELFDVAGKVALVTGGTSGIGAMIAEGYARRGVRTYIAARDLDRARAAAAEIAAAGGHCVGLAADLRDASGAAALIDALKAHETRLDILVNNAGANNRGPITDVSAEAWDDVMDVNLRAPFLLTQQALPLLRAAASDEEHASVINIGSIGGLHIPNWEAYPYGASKAAIHHLTRALAKRLGVEQIRVNAIAPGPFHSRLTDTGSEAVRKSIETYIPVKRAGTPQDIQGVCIFLSSRAGAYINGSTIALDGGYIAAL